MLIFAHRGARGYAPENTMAAFRRALDLGADGIELDVQLSRDGAVVVCHDHTIDRTSDGSGWVRDLTLAELRRRDCGSWFDPAFAGERIPTLEEVLAWLAPTPLLLNVELKNGPVVYPGLEEKTAALLAAFGLQERTVISSFYHPSLRRIRELDRRLRTGVLFACRPLAPLALARDVDAAFLHPHWHYLEADWVATAQRAGVGVNVFTVNTPSELALAQAAGADGIFTDYPDLARRAVSHSGR